MDQQMLVTGLPDEYTEEASGGTKLKRASSWKKFKSTVKGWVGQPEGEPGGGGDPAVPSAVYPTEDVTRATTCVNTVLRNTNCYSGSAGGVTLPQGSPPPYNPQAPDVPSIVVTYDEQRRMPSRPPRRSESLRIRPNNSTPDFSNEVEEAAAAAAAKILQRRQPPAVTASPPMQIPVVRIQSEEEEGDQWVGSLPTPPAGPPPQTTQGAAAAPAPGATSSAEATTANDEMTRKMAVMKIKMAMRNMRAAQDVSSLMVSSNERMLRRHSDINASDVAAVATRKSPSPQAAVAAPALAPLDPAEAAAASAARQQMRRKSTSNASMKKSKTKPLIWEYFEMLPNTSQHGKCKTCKMNVSCKFNTGNFVRHMQLTHKDVYRQYQSKMENAWNKTNLEHSIKQIR